MKTLLLNTGLDYQTPTSIHTLFEPRRATGTEIFSNGQIAGYDFDAGDFTGITHDLTNVRVLNEPVLSLDDVYELNQWPLALISEIEAVAILDEIKDDTDNLSYSKARDVLKESLKIRSKRVSRYLEN